MKKLQSTQIVIISLVAIMTLSMIFMSMFLYRKMLLHIDESLNIGEWGSLGDFFGGVLNPTFTLISIGLLVYTLLQSQKSLQQNQKALEQSQESLKINNKELEISNKALTSSAEAQHTQAISNTFFNLLEQHNNIVNNLHIDTDVITGQVIFEENTNTEFTGRAVFTKLLQLININAKYPVPLLSNYKEIQTNHNYIVGHYFRNLFQIIKYIDEYSDLEIKSKKVSKTRKAQKNNFIRILRSQLSSDELAILLVNCLPKMVDEGQFRDLLVKYKMLKHINFIGFSDDRSRIELSSKISITVASFESYYNAEGDSAFGDNPKAIMIMESIKREKITKS